MLASTKQYIENNEQTIRHFLAGLNEVYSYLEN
jgi:hypothetical protein